MPSARYEPRIPAIERLQTCALDRAAAVIGRTTRINSYMLICCSTESAESTPTANTSRQLTPVRSQYSSESFVGLHVYRMTNNVGMSEAVDSKVPFTFVVDPSKWSFQDGTSATDKFICQSH